MVDNSKDIRETDKAKCDLIENIIKYCKPEHIVYPENKFQIDTVCLK